MPGRRHVKLGFSCMLLAVLAAGCMGTNYYPETPTGHFNLAMKHVTAQDYEGALSVYERVVLVYSGTEYADEANFEMAQIYRNYVRDFDSAANYYDRVLYGDPASDWDMEALYRLGVLYERDILDYSKAKLMYARLMQEYPESPHRNKAQDAIHRIMGMGY